MQINGKTLTISAAAAGAALAATQNAQIALTAPIAIPANVMAWLLPVIAAVVPMLLQQFAPQLLPFWEWLKKLLPMPAELSEYKQIIDAKAINPTCPRWHQQVQDALVDAFNRRHPTPVPAASAPEVTDATK